MKLNTKRVDAFTRWMLKKEAKNRARKLPGFDQNVTNHACGTPACTGGYLSEYPPYRRLVRGCGWAGYFISGGSHWSELYYRVFDGRLTEKIRTALQAVNNLRKLAGLPRLTREDAK